MLPGMRPGFGLPLAHCLLSFTTVKAVNYIFQFE